MQRAVEQNDELCGRGTEEGVRKDAASQLTERLRNDPQRPLEKVMEIDNA